MNTKKITFIRLEPKILAIICSLLVSFNVFPNNIFTLLNPTNDIFNKNSESTINSEITIPNSHIFYFNQNQPIFYRGVAPTGPSHFRDLFKLNIQHVIIFKRSVKGEVENEIYKLNKMGLSNSQITHLPFEWSQFKDIHESCKQIKKMLQTLDYNLKNNIKTFIHCTVGEDRTSMADALWNYWKSTDKNLDTADFFKNRMCHYGYAEGMMSSTKPNDVISIIHQDLTPLYEYIFNELKRIKDKNLSLEEINCENINLRPSQLRCL